MKLYWGPHTCAIGIHILLEEAGLSYETEKLDVGGGGTHEPAFLSINPKGKVPTLLREDGSVLTEFGAIATWIARQAPDAKLIPDDANAEARMTEILEYVEGTVHSQGFGRMFKPALYEPQDTLHIKVGLGQSSVRQQGKEMIEKAFAILDRQLTGRPFASGDTFSIADPALFYVERWSPQQGIELPPNIREHYQMMLARPTVQKVRAFWGES
jgi:glutathione S-transferase